jgi:hypothetical protein
MDDGPAANAGRQMPPGFFAMITPSGMAEKETDKGFLMSFLPKRLQLCKIFNT